MAQHLEFEKNAKLRSVLLSYLDISALASAEKLDGECEERRPRRSVGFLHTLEHRESQTERKSAERSTFFSTGKIKGALEDEWRADEVGQLFLSNRLCLLVEVEMANFLEAVIPKV